MNKVNRRLYFMGKYSLLPQRGFYPQPAYLIGTYKEDVNPNFALITWIS